MRYRLFLIILSMVAFSAAGVRADIVNGNFDNGLVGWNALNCKAAENETAENNLICQDADPNSISNPNEWAVLATQSNLIPLIELNQDIDIPTGASTLSFDFALWSVSSEPTEDLFFNDFLGVYYLDNDQDYDKDLIIIDANGPDGMAGSVLTPQQNGWHHFSAPVGDLAGHSGTIYFDLYDLDNGYESIASIDNVQIETAPVPEPATLLLLGTGLVAVVGLARKKQLF